MERPCGANGHILPLDRGRTDSREAVGFTRLAMAPGQTCRGAVERSHTATCQGRWLPVPIGIGTKTSSAPCDVHLGIPAATRLPLAEKRFGQSVNRADPVGIRARARP
ncbi:hypothetical protein ES707_10577 [subsurface metagenome]